MRFELGLKEQNIVCESLGRGFQSVVPRKGGIDDFDDADTLQIPKRAFLLLPARFHDHTENVQPTFASALADHLPQKFEGQFQARYGAVVIRELFLSDKSQLVDVEPMQAFTQSILDERFEYRSPGLHVLLLRVYRLRDAIFVPDDERTGGCRSWIELPEPHATESVPIISDETFAETESRFDQLAN